MNRTVKLVETNADHRKGPSDDLVAACREGYVPSLSWLVTKEDGSQAMVVLLTAERVEPLPPEPIEMGGPYKSAWTPADVTRLIVAATIAFAVLAGVFAVLSSRA